MSLLNITSRESLEAAIAEVVRLKLTLASLIAAVESDKAAIEKKHAPSLAAKTNVIAEREAEIQGYCVAHRTELFPDKKSLETRTAEIGFELTPWRVEKPRKITWEQVLARLRQLPFARKYIRLGNDVVNKEGLREDREKLTADQLSQMGVMFAQDEQFFIRPKSDIIEPTTQEVP